MISFNEFLSNADELYHEYSFDLRYGQAIMNTLHKTWPEKYEEIKNSQNDCFYDDGIVRILLNKLEKEWPSGY